MSTAYYRTDLYQHKLEEVRKLFRPKYLIVILTVDLLRYGHEQLLTYLFLLSLGSCDELLRLSDGNSSYRFRLQDCPEKGLEQGRTRITSIVTPQWKNVNYFR